MKVPPPVSAALALGLAACATSPPTRFFTLDAVPSAAPAPVPAAPLAPVRVDAVHLPPSMDRPELVRRSGPNEIAVDDFAQWSAPLGETARRAVTQDLAARLPGGAIIYPEAPLPAGARGLVVDVLALDTAGDRVWMDVSWSLTRGRGQAMQADGPRTSRLTTSSSGSSARATARDLGVLLGLLADQIAADLTAEAR